MTRSRLLESELCAATWKLSMATPKPKQQSGSCWHKFHGRVDRYHTVDVIGCRENAVLKNPRGIPILGPSDCLVAIPASASWADYDFLWLHVPDIDPDDPICIRWSR